MSDPSSSQPLPCLKDLQGPQRPAEGAGGARGPGAGWKGGSRLAQGTCACLPAQGRGCLPGAAKETPRGVSAQDTLPPPLTAASETARPHLDHWASSAASLRASSGDCCIGQGLPGRSGVWSPAPAQPAHWGSAAQVHVSVPAALPSGAPRACRPRTATAGAGPAAGGACLLVPAPQTSVGEARPRPRVRGWAQSLSAAPGSSVLPQGGNRRSCSARTGRGFAGVGPGGDPGPGGWLGHVAKPGSLCAPHVNGDGGGPHLTGLCASDESRG